MNESPLMRLYLHAPLFYESALSDSEAKESLSCYELDGEQSESIEPDSDRLLGKLLFSGKGDGKSGDVSLPAGKYLFNQQRKELDLQECIDMAVEQQKDGLWEREKLKNILYIRHLHEDNSPVTQLFRPVFD